MKQIIYKSLFVLCFLMASMLSVNAQDTSEATLVKTHPELAGFYPANMSDNGRFVVCNNGNMTSGNVVKLWDTETNTVTELGINCWARDVSNDGSVIAGQFIEGLNPMADAPVVQGFYKNGKWNVAEYYPSYGPAEGRFLSGDIYCVSPDGKWFGGCLSVGKAIGTKGEYIRPAVWDENGKFVRIHDVSGPKTYRAQARAMSADGTKVAGWSELINNKFYAGNWVPSFWADPKAADPIAVMTTDGKAPFGYFEGMNNDGTIAVGYYKLSDSERYGVIVHADGTIERMGNGFMDISEGGLAVGHDVYSKEFGLVSAYRYFKELYGLDIDPFFIQSVSDNGQYMAITTVGDPNSSKSQFGCVYVRVSGDMLPTVPNKVSLMGGDGNSINIYWELPLYNMHKPIGYNVYRNGTKVNATPINVMTFNDATPIIGKNCYTVSAVYKYREDSEILESPQTSSQCIEAIAENGCFSPKKLTSNLVYNRIVELNWEFPEPLYKSNNRQEGEGIEYTKIKPGIVKSFGVGNMVNSASDGQFLYMTGGLSKYTLDGEFIGRAGGMGNGLAYDGERFVQATKTPKNTSFIIYKEDPMQGYDKITAITQRLDVLRLSYLPFLNEGKGGFELGAFDIGNSVYLDKEFNIIDETAIVGRGQITGVAYYDNVMYVATRETGASMKIFLYDPATQEPTGEYIDMRDYTNLQIGADEKMWGISTVTTSKGIPCLAVIITRAGGFTDNNLMVYLQIGDIKGFSGYNVYRNGTKINNEPILTAAFSEKLLEPDTYGYQVTALFDTGCESAKSEPTFVTVKPIGAVNTPKNLTTENVRNNVILSWSAPKPSTNPKLVGYNIFRNGVKLNPEREYIKDAFYTDKDLALGTYKYEINAFYNNSAESEKIEATVTITGFNPTLAPTDLKLSETRAGLTLDWETPPMGDYEVMTWNAGYAQDYIGLGEGGVFYVASKWEASDLASVFDYTLTDIEFYSAFNIPHTFYIYVDGVIVATQEMSTVKPIEYNLLKLNTPIAIKKGKSLMVAYKVTHEKGKNTVGADRRENVFGKGDLMSTDGEKWVSCAEYKLNANWAISIRLMPYSTGEATKLEGISMETNKSSNINLVASESVRSANEPILKNTEVTGYNVYKNDTKVNSSVVTTKSFIDSSADLSVDNCYSVEALFTADRKSAKSNRLCTFGYCFAPTLSGGVKNNLPELQLSTPTDVLIKEEEIKFYDEERANAIGLGTAEPYYTFIKYNPADLQELDGFKITNISAFIVGKCSISLYIRQGNETILNKSIPDSRITLESMNSFDITEDVTIDASKMLLVGLKITAQNGVQTVGIDAGPSDNYKGDVMSMDGGVTCSSLKDATQGMLDANWNISFEVEKREVLKEKLVGYNIYRDGVKINNTAVTEKIYVDETAVSNKTYKYHATALWDTNCESAVSEPVNLQTPVGVNDLSAANVKVYPNPAKDILNIEGDVETVRFYNSIGQECSRLSGNGERGTGDYHQYSQFTVDVSNWPRGIYIIEVTSPTGEVNRGKVIIN